MALWLGQTISFIGDYFYWLAIPIMVERLTGSALQVGLSIMASALPVLLLGPVAGVFVDRWDRKRTMIVADLLRALLVLACLLVQTPDQVWIYYVVGFLMSCISRFFFPARGAALPLIVTDKSDLLAANGLMQIVETVGLLAGPALAGFTIGLWGSQAAFVVDSASFLVSAAAILIMTVPHTTAGRQAAAGGQHGSGVERDARGRDLLFGSRTMVGVLLCLSVVQLGLGAVNVAVGALHAAHVRRRGRRAGHRRFGPGSRHDRERPGPWLCGLTAEQDGHGRLGLSSSSACSWADWGWRRPLLPSWCSALPSACR